MGLFFLKRFITLLATLIGASIVVFLVLEILPGNAAQMLMGPDASPEAVAALASKLGLDQPASLRYWQWVSGLVVGNMGDSYAYSSPVAELVLERLAVTVPLALMAMAITTYLAAFQFQKIRNFSLWQQALIIGGLSLVGKMTVFWAEHLFSQASLNFSYFWSTLTTMLIWPWVFLVLRKVRRRFNIR